MITKNNTSLYNGNPMTIVVYNIFVMRPVGLFRSMKKVKIDQWIANGTEDRTQIIREHFRHEGRKEQLIIEREV